MQLITLSEVCSRTRYSRWTIQRHRRKFKDYPKPVICTGIRFVEAEIDAFYLNKGRGR